MTRLGARAYVILLRGAASGAARGLTLMLHLVGKGRRDQHLRQPRIGIERDRREQRIEIGMAQRRTAVLRRGGYGAERKEESEHVKQSAADRARHDAPLPKTGSVMPHHAAAQLDLGLMLPASSDRGGGPSLSHAARGDNGEQNALFCSRQILSVSRM